MFLALCWGPVWASRVPGGSQTMEAHEDSQVGAGFGAGSESQHLQQCLHMGSKQEGLGPQGSRKAAANVVGWAGLVPGAEWWWHWGLWIRSRELPSLGGFNGCVVVAREDMDCWWAWLFWATSRLCDL